MKTYPPVPMIEWPLSMQNASDDRVADVQRAIADVERQSQYGWGQTIDFGPFTKEGFLNVAYLGIAGLLDERGWWPRDLRGKRVADVGCFSGGTTALLAAAGAEVVYAVDEIAPHLEQCKIVCSAFDLHNVTYLQTSIYDLLRHIAPGSLDCILLSGVIYHLSDMLLGLHVLHELLKPNGVLLLESASVDDDERSYANFGRFVGGCWWLPTTLCLRDMLEFTVFRDSEIAQYNGTRSIAHAIRAEGEMPFRRGMNWTFDDLRDAITRTTNVYALAPAQPFVPGEETDSA